MFYTILSHPIILLFYVMPIFIPLI
uniref:NADH dehydrogenase subunit 5 n=1 Tax=Heterorhabditis bacteriophora TaxID=37862 RepID=A0A1I7WDE0_HETBA